MKTFLEHIDEDRHHTYHFVCPVADVAIHHPKCKLTSAEYNSNTNS